MKFVTDENVWRLPGVDQKQGDGIVKVDEQLARQASVLPSRAKRGELADSEITGQFHSWASLDRQMVDAAEGIAPSSCITKSVLG